MDETDLDALDGTCFLTNVDGVIEAVGATQWNNFANSNGAPDLTNRSVINRSIFEYMTGTDVKAQISQVMNKVANGTCRAWVMPVQCDSPNRVRNLRQSITRVVSRGRCSALLFQTIELETSQRPPVNLFDFKELDRRAALETNLPTVKVCSWCQKVQHAMICGQAWLHGEDYYAKGGNSNVQITHGICEPCVDIIAHSFRP